MTDLQATRTTIAHIPARQSIDLFSAVGSLIDAALNGALLEPGNGRDVAGTVVAVDGQTEREVVTLLRAAARRLGKRPHRTLPEDEPEHHDDGMTVNQVRKTTDGVEIGFGGSLEAAADMAKMLLGAFIPALAEAGAENYLSFDAVDAATGGSYNLIVVKPDGRSPHELRKAAEAEVERLRSLLDEHGIEDV